ncbi:MAG: methyltransferase domain-containing protein [Candidatus Micrarchaeota archaeon]|nr:methyltransferase domain-containing protein [Candidatus Micrarchaeota archaeon]
MKFLLRKNGIEFYYTDKFMYGKKDGELYKLAMFDRHFYKLKLYNRVPVLEIDGLRMQLVKDFKTPLDYSKEVASRLKITKNDAVLDICTGLGYTAIAASKFANKVITCELSESVLQLARWNPFSSELFSSNIEIKSGDAFSTVKGFKDKTFDVVIHDPPRFSHAPDLYSSQFYTELHRVTKSKARLFHYVGTLGKEKGRKIEDEVKKRLELAGFRDFNYVAKLQGWFFRK